MRKLTLGLFSIVFCSLIAGHVIAQSEKVTIKFVPKPDQTIRVIMTNEGEADLTYEGDIPESLGAMKTMKMVIKIVIVMSQKNGPINPQGRYEAEIAFEKFDTEMSMNGSPIPFGAGTEILIGKKFKAIYDSNSALIDIEAPDNLGIPLENLKQTMKSFYGNLPTEPMSIGETVTLPLNLDFAIPGTAPGPMKFQGESKAKLIALEKDVDGRVAKFDTTDNAKLSQTTDLDLPTGKITMSIDLNMNGNGKSRFNLDSGMLKESETILNIAGKLIMPLQINNVQLPDRSLKGTFKVTVTCTNQRN